LKKVFDSYLPALSPLANRLGVDLDETGPVHLIQQAFVAKHSTLLLVALGVLAYGAASSWSRPSAWWFKKKRWGEYVAVVGTSAFIPLEIHEILAKVTWLRVSALVINLFAIAYLLWTKRLFGLRGGHAAFLAERHNDSLLEVERSASREDAKTR
jgi:Predicted membrane protein